MRSLRSCVLVPWLAAVLLGGCLTKGTPTTPRLVPEAAAYVVTSDFSTGALSVIDLDSRQVSTNVAAIHADATLRVHDGLIYVINRFGQDNIQVIDPDIGFVTRRQYSTGNGSNPQDIAFASPTRAYVSRYGSAELLVVDPRTGTERNVVSLAAFADADGLPEMAQMTLVDPFLFVACQRLTNFAAANPSLIAVIDTRTDQLVDAEPAVPGIQGIALVGRNPFTDLVYDPLTRELLVGCVGDYGVADGGIERIDTVTLRSRGYAITETTLGGDVLDLAWSLPDHSYAVVADAASNTALVSWSATAGAVLDTLYAPGGYSLSDCALGPGGQLFVCDTQFSAPGVRVFHAGPDTLRGGRVDTGLPPIHIAFR